MFTLTRLAATAGAATLLSLAAPTGAPSAATQRDPAPDTYVTTWDAIGSQAFTAAALSPAEGQIIFAYESIAVYDAVMAVHRVYRPFAVIDRAPAGASAQAAVAAAAHGVLVHYLPAQAGAILDPALATSLATIPDGHPKSDGVALGQRVADALIVQRQDDGFRAPVTYTPPDPPVPGVWLPTAPTPPIGTYLGQMRPFALRSADQFRPAGPPALSSKRWARDFNEVKAIGSSTSATRTAAETLAAKFWAEPPVQQAHGSFRLFVSSRGLDIVDAARFMAMVSVTYGDAFIACFEAKYHFAFWRPVTAIHAADTDGNPATVADPTWTTLLAVTPNHPEYPSAHSCVTPAAGIVMARFLGTRHIEYVIPSLTGLGDRSYATPRDLENEVTNARIWGGIHFRSSVEDGTLIAKRTAAYVLAHNFQRVSGCAS
jgi:hypothetical protein